MKYELQDRYPGCPDYFKKGTVLIRYSPIFGFSYYSDIYDNFRIAAKIVENEPLWFKNIE